MSLADDKERLVDDAYIVRLCGVTPRTVTRWRKEGKLPEPTTRTSSGHVRYRRSVIDRWFATRVARQLCPDAGEPTSR